MIDLKRTLQLIQGSLFDSEATWRGYLPDASDWQKTAMLLTVPLVVLSAVIAYLLALTNSGSLFGGMFRPTIVTTLGRIVLGLVAAGVVAFVFSALAGVFGGKRSFALGLAATSLAFVPGYVGQALTWLPWIGGLLAFGLFIYALVLLWRIIPIYLEVPDGKRAAHYIVSLIACLVTMFIIGQLASGILYPGIDDFTGVRSTDRGSTSSGMFGGIMRQAELMEAAEEDRYAPPDDGELTESQVENFIDVMQKTRAIMLEKEQRLRELAKNADKDEDISFSDMSELMSVSTQIAGMNTTEIDVVNTGDGNWAEHQWVRESLRTAWIQKDINDAVKHNYSLYQKYEDQLADHIVR